MTGNAHQKALAEENSAVLLGVKVVFCDVIGLVCYRVAEQLKRQFINRYLCDQRREVLLITIGQQLHVCGRKAVLELLVELRLEVSNE
ncbi:MAG: hypothetical protein INF92_15200 [Rhodobacter sp.]|nr:hypothetical protein [Rhodobacter sp.]